MKKWPVVLMLGLGLAFALSSCGELDQNTDEGVTDNGGGGDTNIGGDTSMGTTYSWIMIQDALTDPSKCNSNPGADIDAVELDRGEIQAYAGGNPVYKSGDVCDKNTANDPSQALGAPDEDDPTDSNNKFVSLNGGYLLVQIFDPNTNQPVVFQNGDQITVYEASIPDKPESKEGYQVYICPDSSGVVSKCKFIAQATGDGSFTIEGLQ